MQKFNQRFLTFVPVMVLIYFSFFKNCDTIYSEQKFQLTKSKNKYCERNKVKSKSYCMNKFLKLVS